MRAALEDDPDDIVTAQAVAAVRAFNHAKVPDLTSHRITATLRDDDGRLCGAVVGRMAGDSVYMEVVWTGEGLRGTGRGSELMRLVEDRARSLGARTAWLYTMSFQAKPFYEKLGYLEFATLPWLGAKHTQHFMRKDL
ncbi:MAG: GNAT family N-acetyltransferase [Alphaproteobacteria bacterium]|nr:GNAT family N-acetyltransferase [Alphaproteobacteria bacterium]